MDDFLNSAVGAYQPYGGYDAIHRPYASFADGSAGLGAWGLPGTGMDILAGMIAGRPDENALYAGAMGYSRSLHTRLRQGQRDQLYSQLADGAAHQAYNLATGVHDMAQGGLTRKQQRAYGRLAQDIGGAAANSPLARSLMEGVGLAAPGFGLATNLADTYYERGSLAMGREYASDISNAASIAGLSQQLFSGSSRYLTYGFEEGDVGAMLSNAARQGRMGTGDMLSAALADRPTAEALQRGVINQDDLNRTGLGAIPAINEAYKRDVEAGRSPSAPDSEYMQARTKAMTDKLSIRAQEEAGTMDALRDLFDEQGQGGKSLQELTQRMDQFIKATAGTSAEARKRLIRETAVALRESGMTLKEYESMVMTADTAAAQFGRRYTNSTKFNARRALNVGEAAGDLELVDQFSVGSKEEIQNRSIIRNETAKAATAGQFTAAVYRLLDADIAQGGGLIDETTEQGKELARMREQRRAGQTVQFSSDIALRSQADQAAFLSQGGGMTVDDARREITDDLANQRTDHSSNGEVDATVAGVVATNTRNEMERSLARRYQQLAQSQGQKLSNEDAAALAKEAMTTINQMGPQAAMEIHKEGSAASNVVAMKLADKARAQGNTALADTFSAAATDPNKLTAEQKRAGASADRATRQGLNDSSKVTGLTTEQYLAAEGEQAQKQQQTNRAQDRLTADWTDDLERYNDEGGINRIRKRLQRAAENGETIGFQDIAGALLGGGNKDEATVAFSAKLTEYGKKRDAAAEALQKRRAAVEAQGGDYASDPEARQLAATVAAYEKMFDELRTSFSDDPETRKKKKEERAKEKAEPGEADGAMLKQPGGGGSAITLSNITFVFNADQRITVGGGTGVAERTSGVS